MPIDKFRGPYFFLSNMYPCFIRYLDLDFKCTESAYQASKTLERHSQNWLAALGGFKAKTESKRLNIRSDWDEVKLGVMEELVRQKFLNEILRQKLVATGREELIEGNTWGDRFWGVYNGAGENNLGKILMRVRDESRRR